MNGRAKSVRSVQDIHNHPLPPSPRGVPSGLRLALRPYEAHNEGPLGALAKESADSPLLFWRKYSDNLPLLAGAAKVCLAIPASSAPAERVFSISGQFHTRQANRTAASTLRDILTLKNRWLGWLDLGSRLPDAPFEQRDDGLDLSELVEDTLADKAEETVELE
jgi:hypothetical protein